MRFAPLLLGLALAAPASAQLPIALGSPGFDAANAVNVGAGGLVVVGGEFEDTVDFDPGVDTATRTAVGFEDAYLAAYASDGSFAWVVTLGSASSDRVDGVASDAGGRPYAIGHFSGPVDFDPGPGTFTLTPQGSQSVFIAAYNPDGSFRWALALGDEDFNVAGDLAVSGTSLFATGGFEGTTDFDPGAASFPLTANRGEDAFVASYSTDGAFRWAFNVGTAGAGASFDEGADIDAHDGHVWVTGMFSGAADFQGGPDQLILDAGTGFNDLYVARYAADGPATGPTFEWGFGIGADGFDGGLGLATDAALNVYVTGFFNGTADFDPGGASTDLTAVGSQDAFVASYGSLGGFRWAFPLGSAEFQSGLAIAYRDDAVYVGGSFGGTVDFDPGAADLSLTAAGFDDFFVARYGAAQPDLRWVVSAGAEGSSDAVNSLSTSAFDGALFVAGDFEGSADFDPGPATDTRTSAGLTDGFLARYNDDGTLTTAGEPGAPAASALTLTVTGPNPAVGRASFALSVPAAQPVRVEAFDALGRQVALLHDGTLGAGDHALTLDLGGYAPGLYVVRATAADGERAVRRFVVR